MDNNHSIFFKTRDELIRVCLDDVMYAGSDGNYITLKFKSGRTLTLLTSLHNFCQLTDSISGIHFVRVGRSYVVNTTYISQINNLRRSITLVDDDVKLSTELVVPKEAIRQLREHLSAQPCHSFTDFSTKNGSMEAFQRND